MNLPISYMRQALKAAYSDGTMAGKYEVVEAEIQVAARVEHTPPLFLLLLLLLLLLLPVQNSSSETLPHSPYPPKGLLPPHALHPLHLHLLHLQGAPLPHH